VIEKIPEAEGSISHARFRRARDTFEKVNDAVVA
jgi:hypothetical protein